MYNWRLLLLALVAVFQPIASFTERNLVNGRQQCCDRRTDPLLRDSRSSFYGAHLTTATNLLRNSKDRDAIQGNVLRQRDRVLIRRSVETSLEDIRERDTKRNVVRSTRIDYRPERLPIDEHRERRHDVQRRERFARNGYDVKPEKYNRKFLDQVAGDSLRRYNDRTAEISSRNTLSRDDSRINHFRDEPRELNDKREQMSTRLRDLRKLTLTRDTQDNLQPTKENVARADYDNRRYIARERESIQRDTLSRMNVRRYIEHNNERREQERYAVRRSQSEDSRVKAIRDVRLRDNYRDARREHHDDSNANRRLMTERFEERRLREIGRVRIIPLKEDSREMRQDSRERDSVNQRFITERFEGRRLQTEAAVERIHYMAVRQNSRDERRNSRDRVSTDRRLMNERSEESRVQKDDEERVLDMTLRQNSRDERRNSRDRVSTDRRLMTKRSEERRLQQDNEERVLDMTRRQNSRVETKNSRARLSTDRRLMVVKSEERHLQKDGEERVLDMTMRKSSQDMRRNSRDRISTEQRLMTERSEERRLQKDREERNLDITLRKNTRDERRNNRARFSADRRLMVVRSEQGHLQKDGEERVLDMTLRKNSLDERRNSRDRVSTYRRLMTQRSEERRLQRDGEERVLDMTLRQNSRDESRNSRNRVGTDRRLMIKRIEERRLQRGGEVERVPIMALQHSRDESRDARNHLSANRRLMIERIEERRLQTDIEVHRVREMHRRQNSRDERRNSHDNLSANQRLASDRFDEHRQQADDNKVKRFRDMHLRENSRDERQQNRMNANRRLVTERLEERRNVRNNGIERARNIRQREDLPINTYSRSMTERLEERRLQKDDLRRSMEQIRKSTDSRPSRMFSQRNTREFRSMNDINLRLDRVVDNRPDHRYSEQSGETRNDRIVRERVMNVRESRKTRSVERDNRITDRRARSLDLRNYATSTEATLKRAAELVRGRDASRKLFEYGNKMDSRERDAVDTRFRHVEVTKNAIRGNDDVIETAISNWQYLFYTLQGAYLCSLFVQMLTPNRTEKSKMMHLRWWPMSSHRLIKVD